MHCQSGRYANGSGNHPWFLIVGRTVQHGGKEIEMANATKNHFGEGSQGKKSGTGAMTHMDLDKIGENDVLSNRDKAQHSRGRGLDGKAIKSEQYQDHAANRVVPVEELDESRRDSGLLKN
jgi:hypothetical protein